MPARPGLVGQFRRGSSGHRRPNCSSAVENVRRPKKRLAIGRRAAAAMDSPIASRLFRQLFRHPACRTKRSLSRLKAGAVRHGLGPAQRRHYAVKRGGGGSGEPSTNESRWQQRTNLFPEDMTEEFDKYPYLTAEDLKARDVRPKRAKMLLRDFIDGSFSRPPGSLAEREEGRNAGSPPDGGRRERTAGRTNQGVTDCPRTSES